MRKLLSLLAALALVVTLAACEKEVIKEVEVEKIVEVEKAPIEIPAEVTMSNIDDFLERENVQLVDLRNYSDKVQGGYIAGFEIISFFEHLEGYAIARNDGWTWQADNMLDADTLENLFDKDADAIMLMCMSGTRAGFVKAALEQLGYTNVLNIGGFKDYSGENKVFGMDYEGKVLPKEVTMENVDSVLNADNVQFVDLRNWQDKMNSGYIAGFEFIPFFQYLESSNILVRTDGDWDFAAEDIVDEDILRNFFNEDARAIYLMCGSGTRAGFVKDALESLGYTNVHNVGGISSYDGDNKVMGDGTYKFPAA